MVTMDTSQKVIIVGAGGLSRELYSWLKNDFQVEGFIDDNLKALHEYNYPATIISSIEDYSPSNDVKLVLGIMNPCTKKIVVEKLKAKGAKFLTFVHSTCILGENVKLGEGVVICPLAVLTCDSEIGDFSFINVNSTLGHDCRVGKYCSINSKVEIGGGNTIGKEVLIGSRALILPGKKISDNATVGSGSVVVGNISKPVSVFGNPARVL
ncbi:MAG: sugar O-acyltransferase [Halobacteriovoraceae bacterium]|nr:sugar O-acyltransferase [Halobacteriovoraceae bacterium]|tara:strand:+ start:6879 stop:7508 length:630 start_codon:yes stop_codon:yes gene_type:complete